MVEESDHRSVLDLPSFARSLSLLLALLITTVGGVVLVLTAIGRLYPPFLAAGDPVFAAMPMLLAGVAAWGIHRNEEPYLLVGVGSYILFSFLLLPTQGRIHALLGVPALLVAVFLYLGSEEVRGRTDRAT